MGLKIVTIILNIFFRGRGSELLRQASCVLIESIAKSQLTIPLKTQVGRNERIVFLSLMKLLCYHRFHWWKH